MKRSVSDLIKERNKRQSTPTASDLYERQTNEASEGIRKQQKAREEAVKMLQGTVSSMSDEDRKNFEQYNRTSGDGIKIGPITIGGQTGTKSKIHNYAKTKLENSGYSDDEIEKYASAVKQYGTAVDQKKHQEMYDSIADVYDTANELYTSNRKFSTKDGKVYSGKKDLSVYLQQAGIDADKADEIASNWKTMQQYADATRSNENKTKGYEMLDSLPEDDYKKFQQLVSIESDQEDALTFYEENGVDNDAYASQEATRKKLEKELKAKYPDNYDDILYYANVRGNEERTQQMVQDTKSSVKSGVGGAVGEFVGDVLNSPASIAGTIDIARQRANGDPVIDTNTKAMQYSNYDTAVNEAWNERIGDEHPIGQFMYGVANSTAKSAYNMAVASLAGGVLGEGVVSSLGLTGKGAETAMEFATNAVALPSFSASAFNSTLTEDLENGIGENEAIAHATATGIFEAMFEVLSLDKIYKIYQTAGKTAMKTALKDVAKNVAISAGIEGSEEGFTDIADWAADAIINGDFSEYNRIAAQYGTEYATKYYVKQLGQDVLAGAISGGVMGAGANLLGDVKGGSVVDALNQTGRVTEVREIAKNAPEDSTAYKIATSEKENLSNREVRQMVQSLSAIAETESSVHDVVKNALVETGMSEEDAETSVSNIVTANVTGDSSNLGEEEQRVYSNLAGGAYNTQTVGQDAMNVLDRAAEEKQMLSSGRVLNDNLDENGLDAKDIDDVSIDNGKISIKTTSGKTISASKATFKNEETIGFVDRLLQTTYDSNYRQSLISAYKNSDMGYSDFMRITDYALQLAFNHKTQDEIQKEIVKNAGSRISIGDAVALAKSAIKESGRIVAFNTSAETQKTIKKIAEKRGVTVRFLESITSEENNGAYANGEHTATEILLALDSSQPLTVVFAHEFTHWLKLNDENAFKALRKEGAGWLHQTGSFYTTIENRIRDDYAGQLATLSEEEQKEFIDEEITAYMTEAIMQKLSNMSDKEARAFVRNMSEDDRTLLQKIIDYVNEFLDRVRKTLGKYDADHAEAKALAKNAAQLQRFAEVFTQALSGEVEFVEINNESVEEATEEYMPEKTFSESDMEHGENYSLRLNAKLMETTRKFVTDKDNPEHGKIDKKTLDALETQRKYLETKLNELKHLLPEDLEGETSKDNASYIKTIENSLVCVRSLISGYYMDQISEKIGRPMTIEEQLVASQILAKLTGNQMECSYCYVATDRRTYRALFNTYYNDYMAMRKKVQESPEKYRQSVASGIQQFKTSEKAKKWATKNELFRDFLHNGKSVRSATDNMWDRYKLFIEDALSGEPSITLSDLATAKSRNDAKGSKGDRARRLVEDSEAWAKSSAWPINTTREVKVGNETRQVDYVAYNGSILNWSKDLIDELNADYGLRMYSYSDYVPQFLLENIQMVTDAAARGLKMLAYTKDIGFARTFAHTGMGINISTFGFKGNGTILENGMMGAEWEEAKAIREENPAVGIVYVATSNEMVKWAMAQDWIDVVIPYHLVRTGKEVASYYGYTNFSTTQADKHLKGWDKEKDLSSIPPTVHHNDFATYIQACKDNHLKPRFSQFLPSDTNGITEEMYMKLVNETRLSYEEEQPVQPVFEWKDIYKELARITAEGKYGLLQGISDDKQQLDILREYINEASNLMSDDEDFQTYVDQQRKENQSFNEDYENAGKKTKSKKKKTEADSISDVVTHLSIRTSSLDDDNTQALVYFAGGGTLEAALDDVLPTTKAVEWNKQVAEVHRQNYGDNLFVGDVRDFDFEALKGKVKYFHASPSCQRFSRANNKAGATDTDVTTAKATAKAIRELKPEVFTLENVVGYEESLPYKIIREALEDEGYTWDVHKYTASDYGAHTIRKRLIIRATLNGTLPEVKKVSGVDTSWYSVVEDLIDELPERPLTRVLNENAHNTNGLDIEHLTEPVLIIGTNKGRTVSWAPASKPAPTILVKSDEARILMPDGRVLRATPRVLARIQGLPDNYDLPKGIINAYKVVGNGIPTQLTDAVIKPMVEMVTGTKEAKYSLRDASMKELDSRYMELAQNPHENEAELRKMVEEAARRHGYDSPMLYHGTTQFGFTKVDTSKSDDSISFFATDSEEVAKTYSYNSPTRNIGGEIDYDKMLEDASKEYNKLVKSLSDAINGMAKKTIITANDLDSNLTDAYGTFMDSGDEDTLFDDIMEMVREYAEDAYDASGSELSYDWFYDYFTDAVFQPAGKLAKSIANNKSIIEAQQYGSYDSGIYSLYANTDNMLVVNGRGNNWNGIPVFTYDVVNGKYRVATGLFGQDRSSVEFNTLDEAKEYAEKMGYLLLKNSKFEASTREISRYAEKNGYSGVLFKSIKDNGGKGNNVTEPSDVYVFFNPQEQVKSADPVTYNDGLVIPLSARFDESNDDIRYSLRDSSGIAPTFYSQMSRTIDSIKQDKIGAASVVPYLKGHGVKGEEIKWSGIQTFLDGKKSVSKADLQEFANGSMLQIEEETLGGKKLVHDIDYGDDYSQEKFLYDAKHFAEANEYTYEIRENDNYISVAFYDSDGEVVTDYAVAKSNGTKYPGYTTPYHKNYRELLFKMSDSDYKSPHWDSLGVLAHARVDDMELADGSKMLFVEEIQSDLHNLGSKSGYVGKKADLRSEINKLKEERDNLHTDVFNDIISILDSQFKSLGLDRDYNADTFSLDIIDGEEWAIGLLKRLGVDLTEIYPIVDKFRKDTENVEGSIKDLESDMDKAPDAPFKTTYTDFVMKRLIRMAAEDGYDYIGWTTGKMQVARWKPDFAEGYRIEYDQDIPKFMKKYCKQWGTEVTKTDIASGDEVWSVKLTDAMKESVLYEGQPMYSLRNTSTTESARTELSDVEKNAVSIFGTTENYEEAGYILPNGEMLKFSNGSGTREYDHRAIALAYGQKVDLGKNHGFSEENGKYLDEFVESGNIRIDSGDLDLAMNIGLQISSNVPLTSEQEKTIRKFIEWEQDREENYDPNSDESGWSLYNGPLSINIDFGGDSSYSPGAASAKDTSALGVKSLHYNGKVNAQRVISDIRLYFATGELRHQSVVDQFHYSLRNTSTTESAPQDKEAESIIERGIKASGKLPIAEKDVEQIASAMLKHSYSSYSKKDLVYNLKALYGAIGKTQVSYSDLMQTAFQIAMPVVKASAFYNDSNDNQSEAFDLSLMAFQEYFRRTGTNTESVNKQLEKLREKYEKRIAGMKTRRDEAELRQQIYTLKSQIDKMLNKPTKTSYIPVNLMRAMAKMASLVDVRTERMTYKTVDTLKELSEAYESILTDETYGKDGIPTIYDPEIASFISTLEKKFRGKTVQTMDKEDLEVVKTILTSAVYMVRAENKFVSEERSESMDEASEKGMAEVLATKGYVPGNIFSTFNNMYQSNALNFERIMRRMFGYTRGSEGEWMAESLKKAEVRYLSNMMEVDDIFSEVTDRRKILDFQGKNKRGKYDESTWVELPPAADGSVIKVPKALRMSIIMHLMNDDSARHAAYGGFVVPEVLRYKAGKIKEAYEVGENYRINLLSDEDIEGAKELVASFESYDDNSGRFIENPDNPLIQAYHKAVKNERELKRDDYGTKAQWEDAKADAHKAVVDAWDAWQNGRRDAYNALNYLIKSRSEKFVKELIAELDDYERAYLKAAQEFFWKWSGAKINEATLKTAGYKKANVSHYYPIKVSSSSIGQDEMSGAKFDGTLEGSKFLKERVHSKLPIMLDDITRVTARHSADASKYNAYAAPIKDIKTLLNKVQKNGQKYGERSLHQVIVNKWGDEGAGYEAITKTIADIESGRKTDRSPFDKIANTIRGNFAAATLTGNVGVTIKQFASYPTAAAEVGWKALNRAFKHFVGSKGIDEIESRTPLMQYRKTGESMYSYEGNRKLSDENKAVSLFTGMIQGMDVRTVRTLEYAAKEWADEEIKKGRLTYTDENGDVRAVEKGSSRYWDIVTEKFNNIVRRTQPNYTFLERPELLKNQNALLRSIFMFKTQPLQNYGILYDSIGEYKAMQSALKSSPNDKNVQSQYTEAKGRLVSAVTSNLVAQALYALMTLAAKLVYHSVYDLLDDDDDKLDPVTVAEMLGNSFMEAEAGMFLAGGELYDYIMSKITEDSKYPVKSYGLSDSVLSTWNDITDATDNWMNAIKKWRKAETTSEKMSARRSVAYSTRLVATKAAVMFGVPVNNIYKPLNSMVAYIEDFANKDLWSGDGYLSYEWKNNVDSQYEMMLDAIESNDMTTFDKLLKEQIGASDASDPEKTVKKNVKDAIKDAYDEDEISESEARAILNKAAGKIGVDDVDATMDEWKYKKETGATSYSKYSRMDDAISSVISSNTTDYTKVYSEIKTLVDGGADKSDIYSHMRNKYKDEYVELYNQGKASQLNAVLVKALVYAGYTQDKATENLKNWTKKDDK